MKTKHLLQILRCFGIKWATYRLWYEFARRSGIIEKITCPATGWSQEHTWELSEDSRIDDETLRTGNPALGRFFFNQEDLNDFSGYFAKWDKTTACKNSADELLCGRLKYFGRLEVSSGFPPDWHKNHISSLSLPKDIHWSKIDDSAAGDIKIIWEPSRFSFSYDLARAYRRTRDERYSEAFWEVLNDWRANNPPNKGVNWKCGQEIGLRVMAWIFGLYAFMDSASATAGRIRTLMQMIAVSAKRIEANISYALSQKNNHGISEAAGLYTAGLLFPGFKDSDKWVEKGRALLEKLGHELIYRDGSFVQHSFNYQRLMLHVYLWVMGLAEANGKFFSDSLKQRLLASAELLYQVMDVETGRVPNYGSNDGALILPLNNCDYNDFRPIVQAVTYSLTGTRRFDEGPWDEDLLWLFGKRALKSETLIKIQTDLAAEDGGYHTLRTDEGFSLIRCCKYRNRPFQADMLHADIWWKGINIATDPGTFSYNAPPPWDNALAGTAFHNTAAPDGKDQMDRVGKFIWVPWIDGEIILKRNSEGGFIKYIEARHDGYKRNAPQVSHLRGIVCIGSQHWLVCDRLESTGMHDYRLHWLFPDLPYQFDGSGRLSLETPKGTYGVVIGELENKAYFSIVRADSKSPRGWKSLHYCERIPALSIDASVRASTSLFWTLFGPGQMKVESFSGCLVINTGTFNITIGFNNEDHMCAILTNIEVEGSIEDSLDLTI